MVMYVCMYVNKDFFSQYFFLFFLVQGPAGLKLGSIIRLEGPFRFDKIQEACRKTPA